MAAEAATGALHATKETFGEALHVVLEYLVPLGAAVAGFFLNGLPLGGTNSFYNMLTRIQGMTTGTASRIALGLAALVNGIVGYCFWPLRHRDGLVMKLIGGAVGGFFFGTSIGLAIQIISPKGGTPDGLIEAIAGGVTNVAQGG